MAHRVLVNSAFTAGVFASTFGRLAAAGVAPQVGPVGFAMSDVRMAVPPRRPRIHSLFSCPNSLAEPKSSACLCRNWWHRQVRTSGFRRPDILLFCDTSECLPLSAGRNEVMPMCQGGSDPQRMGGSSAWSEEASGLQSPFRWQCCWPAWHTASTHPERSCMRRL